MARASLDVFLNHLHIDFAIVNTIFTIPVVFAARKAAHNAPGNNSALENLTVHAKNSRLLNVEMLIIKLF